MKTKFLILAAGAGVLALTTILYSTVQISGHARAEEIYRQQAKTNQAAADYELNCAAVYQRSVQINRETDKILNTSGGDAQAQHKADWCNTKAAHFQVNQTEETTAATALQNTRQNFYEPLRAVGIIFAIICPILLTTSWLIPKKTNSNPPPSP